MNTPEPCDLSALLSQVLIAFTLDFDRELEARRTASSSNEPAPSLAMWANVLRFIGEDGVEVRRLPALSGISKSVTHTMVACLARHGWVTVEARGATKGANVLVLTPRGRELAMVWKSAATDVERKWSERYGSQTAETLRFALETVVSHLGGTLAHYPMATPHRGGTPTGH